jgi:peptide/nickel transport system permease protein
MVVAIALGVSLGLVAAVVRNSWLDVLSMLVALLGVSMPSFWLGLLLILGLSLHLGWFPATGGGDLRHLVMPALTLGIIASALIARLTRSAMLEVLGQDYVRTARAKGLAGWNVVVRHGLANALIPIVTIFGLQFGNLLAGAVIVETVFSRPGVGRLIVGGILNKDFPLVQGTILFVATAYVLINLLVDLSYAVLDPRIRLR